MGLDIYFKRTNVIDCGYFRKINFLIPYFSKKYDLENRVPISITKEDIEELIVLCHNVLTDHSSAPNLLPTCPGFFFGNIEYNDNYFEDVYKVYCFCKEFIKQFDNIDSEYTVTIDF